MLMKVKKTHDIKTTDKKRVSEYGIVNDIYIISIFKHGRVKIL